MTTETAAGVGPADRGFDTDVAVVGGGSAAEALVRALHGSDLRVTVFEPARVGGECPFVACMPSKSLLHDARAGNQWGRAVRRRHEVTSGLDDTGHADDLLGLGVDLVRAPAELLDAHTVLAEGRRVTARHVVLATGAMPSVPDLEGLDACAALVWTSEDAMTTDVLPERLVVVGGGVIGTEAAFLFSGFGAAVALVETADRLFPNGPPRVSALLEAALRAKGVDVRCGVEVRRLLPIADAGPEGAERLEGVDVVIDDGSTLRADRVLVAVGRRPSTIGLGLDRLGLDDTAPLPVDQRGRVRCDGSVWAMGDVAGVGQYTHLANHHAAVIADQLAGSGQRRFDEVVVPGCVFSSPPMFVVGGDYAELHDDDDVVEASAELASFPRAMTDELADGHLWVAARRRTGTVVAAAGIGPTFDELVHALVVAIDGDVPVERLRRSIRPFPTVGEILGPIMDDLSDRLTARPNE